MAGKSKEGIIMDWIDSVVAVGNMIDAQNRAEFTKQRIDVMMDARICFRLDKETETEVPDKEKVDHAVNVLIGLAAMKAKVLVHCFQGKDRAPFLVACYLIRRYRTSPEVAYSQVQKKHKDTICHWDWLNLR